MNVYGGPGRAKSMLMPPGSCTLCRQSPDQETTAIFETGVTVINEATRLPEHIYVCEGCARSMARELGWASQEEQEELSEIMAEMHLELQHLRRQVKDYSSFEEIMERYIQGDARAGV